MRVLYLYQYFVTPSHHGMTRAYEFARRLIANGHDVKVITGPGYLPDEYKHFKKVTEVNIDGVPTLIIPVAYSHHMSFTRRIISFIGFAARASMTCMNTPADVVYASSGPLTIAIPAIAVKLWQRIPMVFEVRDLWPEMPIALGILRNPVIKSIARLMEWVAYHSAKHVVALSPGMAEGIQKRGIPEDQISVIPNCSDVDLFDVPNETGIPVRQQIGLTKDQPLIVYTGTLGFTNKVSYLVDIANEMYEINPNVRFLIVGSGNDADNVFQRAKDVQVLDRNLTIWEPIPKTKLASVLSAATATTAIFTNVPEMNKNSANKFFDSMAAGRPIVINYAGWQAELLAETGAGISIPPEDAYTAAIMIAEFMCDEKRLAQARQAARDLAYNRFHRDKMYAEFEAVLKKAIESDA